MLASSLRRRSGVRRRPRLPRHTGTGHGLTTCTVQSSSAWRAPCASVSLGQADVLFVAQEGRQGCHALAASRRHRQSLTQSVCASLTATVQSVSAARSSVAILGLAIVGSTPHSLFQARGFAAPPCHVGRAALAIARSRSNPDTICCGGAYLHAVVDANIWLQAQMQRRRWRRTNARLAQPDTTWMMPQGHGSACSPLETHASSHAIEARPKCEICKCRNRSAGLPDIDRSTSQLVKHKSDLGESC